MFLDGTRYYRFYDQTFVYFRSVKDIRSLRLSIISHDLPRQTELLVGMRTFFSLRFVFLLNSGPKVQRNSRPLTKTMRYDQKLQNSPEKDPRQDGSVPPFLSGHLQSKGKSLLVDYDVENIDL